MTYPGGKNGEGVYQKIISMMPPHDVYIEPFLGSGAVMRHKLPARLNIGIDADVELILKTDARRWVENSDFDFDISCGDGVTYLKSNESFLDDDRTLVYCDPPYPFAVRSSSKAIYKYEFGAPSQHCKLLNALIALPCMVMISSYENSLYNRKLKGWRKEFFYTTNRAGERVQETVYLNFPQPLKLHDYRYLGANFRERERIKRKTDRWKRRLESMPPLERHALMSAIATLRSTIVKNNDR